MTSSHRRRRPHGAGQPRIVVICIAVLMSMLGPGLTAGAQDDPPATPVVLDTQEAEGTLPDDPGTATMEETGDPTETVTADATDQPTQDGTATANRRITTFAGTSTVVVEQHTCSAAVTDPELLSYSDLSTTYCLESIAPVSFTVSDGAGYAQTLAASPTSWGQTATFNDVPATTVTISQSVPAGYENPVVFCREFGTAAPGSFALQPVTGRSVTWPLVGGSEAHCAFFSEPTGADDTGDLSEGSNLALTVTGCPAGFDLATDSPSACTTDVNGVDFAVGGPSGSFTGTTGDATAGGVAFPGLAPGDYTISMTVPAGASSVFLWSCQKVGVPAESPSSPLATSSSHTLTIETGFDYVCQWYVVPTGDGPGDDDATGTVHVSKYTCPEGVAPTDDDYALSEQCRETVDPVSFEVSDSAGADIPLTLDPGVPQSGEVSGLAFGTIWIAEIVPDGYGEPRVFCSDTPSDGAGNYEPVPVLGGNAAEVELRADAEMPLSCLFFNFPDGDDDRESGTVQVSKYTCPAGVERSDDDYLLSERCREDIDPVDFTIIATAGGYEQTRTASPGVPQSAVFADVPFGEIAIEETVPAGYGHPLVFCADTAADGPGAYEPVAPWPESGAFIVQHRADAEIDLSCIFFNFPEDDPGNTVTVNKYTCPSWVNPETDVLLDACAPGGDGIAFDLVDGNGRHPAAVSGGGIAWTDVVIGAEGELQIIEDIPAGYGDPWVVCDGILMASANGFVIPNPGDARPFHVECDWFNFALEDASLAVVKHTCAPGYDLHAAGADPMTDCPELTDGVDFRIVGMGADMTSTTGDAGAGMVQFGGLDPGSYTLTETVPAGTASSFVLDCHGAAVGAVRPYPLSTGDTLDLTLHASEAVTCHWFNVPAIEGGGLTVIKHLCTGEAFASEVDCEVYEDGVTFDLAIRRDGAWVNIATATTDDHGRIAWTGLEPGRYWLGEHGDPWCHLASEQLNDDQTGIIVEDGETAIVNVYNCGATPGKPGTTPTTYPDTGVPPASAGDGGGENVPAAALAGLLALPLTRRRLVGVATVLPTAGVVGRTLAQDGDQVIEPIDGTTAPAVAPGSLCLPSAGDGCARGPVPATLRIDTIGVDAPVEMLETIAGEMQQPTDATHVAWYKETARLGEPGNMLLAGHLNWWGVPEAVFYNLGMLAAGDEIVAGDEDGGRWVYVVEWVRQVPGGEEPDDEVLGATAWPAVTLITCGGTWDSAASAYDQRTVVRANLVESA